ncbi:MAG: hypothetical protein GX431_05660 [Bacteroidales bacterium]|nr:hypothetical protein [Bacteroidales bacterium]
MKATKYILIVLAIASLNSGIAAQNSRTERKIRSIVVTQEKYDMLVTRKYKESEQYFDNRGNLVEDITYKQGKISKHFKYQYDADNNKIREEEYDPAGRLIEYSEYKYENGLRVEKNVYDPNKKLKSRKIYQYTEY